LAKFREKFKIKKMENLKLAIQKSGRIAEKSLELLKNAGFEFEIFDRSLSARCKNFPLEILFFRVSDIPEIVADATVDAGICGQNSVAEKKVKIAEIEKLGFGNCRLSIAAPIAAKKFSLAKKKIATSYPQILKKFLREKKIAAEIIELSGSVEIAPRLEIADAICDLVSSGSTLKMHGLHEIEQIFFSQCALISHRKFSATKKKIFENFLTRIRAVLRAKKLKYILMNAPKKSLPAIKKLLPGLQNPTISPLADKNFFSVATVVDENFFWNTAEKLKKCGATGILVLPIEKIIL